MKKMFLVAILMMTAAFCFAKKRTFVYHVGSVLKSYNSENIAFMDDFVITEILPVDKSLCRVSFILADDKFLHLTEYLRIGERVKIRGLIEHTVKSFDYNRIEFEEDYDLDEDIPDDR